jgi:hypothetical protein
MLQPHSLLWHYLWIAPCAILVALAVMMWKRGLHKEFPAFFSYAIFESVGGAIIYALDISPHVSGETYWRSYFFFSALDVLIKFAVIGEVFTHLLRRYAPLGRLAKILITGVGAVLILTAVILAAYSNSTAFWVISATRILGRSVSVVQCGLIVFIVAFASRYDLRWERSVFGMALGLGIVAGVHVAYWALMQEWFLGQRTYLLDFMNMATYHVCVLIWCYYLLVPHKVVTTSAVALPENDLAIWNRELERLLQQ